VERADVDRLDELLASEDGMHMLLEGERASILVERERIARRLKRAAHEQLHSAMTAPPGERSRLLRSALEVARKREVEEADIAEAEEMLEAALAAEKDPWASADGSRAFDAIATDDVATLQEALVSGGAWASWRNSHGEDLLAAAKAGNAEKVVAFLTRDGGLGAADWKQAFKLVCRDDAVALADLLASVSPLVWAEQRNAGGKTLIELADERERTQAYTWLALARGQVRELAPESVSVGDAVWVFEDGCIQPRAAKVSATEDGEATVAYWDDAVETRTVPVQRLRRMR
jgi:hypothetical protein